MTNNTDQCPVQMTSSSRRCAGCRSRRRTRFCSSTPSTTGRRSTRFDVSGSRSKRNAADTANSRASSPATRYTPVTAVLLPGGVPEAAGQGNINRIRPSHYSNTDILKTIADLFKSPDRRPPPTEQTSSISSRSLSVGHLRMLSSIARL